MKPQPLHINLDFIGMSTSLLCAFHCAGLPFLLSLAPLAGLSILHHPVIEYGIISLTLVIAITALRKGYLKYHGKLTAIIMVCIGFTLIISGHLLGNEFYEVFMLSIGGTTIAAAHFINWKLIRKSKTPFPVCMNKND
ncbi:MAG TPA: MerC domain-containing protein [Cytophagales bacterium]|jgi:hypothetical protein|nr:MerC domain-containing protein [Cytophagales bacterium]